MHPDTRRRFRNLRDDMTLSDSYEDNVSAMQWNYDFKWRKLAKFSLEQSFDAHMLPRFRHTLTEFHVDEIKDDVILASLFSGDAQAIAESVVFDTARAFVRVGGAER